VTETRFPNFRDKHAQEAVFSPDEAVGRYRDDPSTVLPDAVVLTYQRSLLAELSARGLERRDGYPGPWRSLWFVERGERNIAVAGGFGVGAPVASMVLEELVALGATEFVSIGVAGCLQPRCRFGDIVVCTAAVRDEGVSHHYAPTDKFSWPSEALTARLASTLDGEGTPTEAGVAWTIDAPYRETVAEARSYQAEGVICVEMEAAALFTVAAHRRVELAAAFVVSDHLLVEDRWTHAFGSEVVNDALLRLLDAAIRTLGGGGLPAR
jgi:uridine phosphorylase